MIKKTCTICGVPKSLYDCFNRNAKSRDGYRHDCRMCQALAFKAYKATRAAEHYHAESEGRR